MGKFSLKKKDDGDDDSSRLALFGSRNKQSKSPAPASSNPYAQPTIPPDPYTRAKMNAGIGSSSPQPTNVRPGYQAAPPLEGNAYGGMSQPAPPQSGYGGMRQNGPPQGAYGRDNSYGPPSSGYSRDNSSGAPTSGYGSDNKYAPSQGGYGAQGYGSEKFGKPNPYGQQSAGGNSYGGLSQPSGPPQYSGGAGYGGLGRTNSTDTTTTDANRDELFGGARDRIQQRQQGGQGLPPDYQYNPSGGSEQERSYGAYGDRQLTAEEEEEEDVAATKQEIRFMKQQDVSSTRNALQMAHQAEESGRNTLARLGAQSESIHNTERNLDIAENQARTGDDKIKEINKLNRSMFAVHVNNPFTAGSRRDKREEEIVRRHQLERDQREESRDAAFQASQRMNQNFKELEDVERRRPPPSKTSLAERAKYQFEADSEDDALEDEIDSNLEQLSGAAGRLNLLAKATGQEITAQNEQLLRLAGKSDRFDERLHLQTDRMKRIR